MTFIKILNTSLIIKIHTRGSRRVASWAPAAGDVGDGGGAVEWGCLGIKTTLSGGRAGPGQGHFCWPLTLAQGQLGPRPVGSSQGWARADPDPQS